MNPLLCQLSYGAIRTGVGYTVFTAVGKWGSAVSCLTEVGTPKDHCDMTRLMVNIGRRRAMATPPMIRPIMTIMMGSM